MAKKNVLFERDNFIGQLINRAGIAGVNIDGGMAVAEGAIVAGNDELYTLTPATADTKRVGIAFNPSVKYDNINGKLFPAKSLDDRDYTNPAGKPVDYFFPTVGIEFGINKAGIAGNTEPEVGDFLEIDANGKYAIKQSQTAGVPSFEVVQIIEQKYPTMTFADDVEKSYIIKTRYNG